MSDDVKATVRPAAAAIEFEGRTIPALAGEPVAVALWRAGERVLARSVKYHRPRGVQCMQEQCASCLVRIDGLPNRFACTTPCADGMTVARQNAYPNASVDILRSIDWAFPTTFNHHEMLAGVPIVSGLMAKVARQLSGLGQLPAEAGAAFEAPQEISVDRLVVGLGRSGRGFLRQLGANDLALDARAFGDGRGVWSQARALGIYLEAGEPVVAVRRQRTLTRVRPQTLALCVGSRSQIASFPGNDLPGVMTDDAALALAAHGVLAGARALLVGKVVGQLAERLRFAGVEVSAIGQPTLLRARGRHALRGAVYQLTPEASPVRFRGELIVCAGERAPAFELAQQAGAALRFAPGRGFAIETDAGGQTRLPWLSAFGSCASGGA